MTTKISLFDIGDKFQILVTNFKSWLICDTDSALDVADFGHEILIIRRNPSPISQTCRQNISYQTICHQHRRSLPNDKPQQVDSSIEFFLAPQQDCDLSTTE